MAQIPKTSVTLINAVSGDWGCSRWNELYSAYERPIRDFLSAPYPTLEQDDVIQESMLALAKALPGYRYDPDANGHFRNYLMGIVKHKATDAIARRAREAAKRDELRAEEPPRTAADDESWREDALEVALSQLMSDSSIDPRNREIFRHVALMRERPDDVAARFGVTRNNVDQIKSRMTRKLADMLSAMTEER